MKYFERTYRNKIGVNNLISFSVCEQQTDLFIQADMDLSTQARASVHIYRSHLKDYIKSNPSFLTSLRPLPNDPFALPIVRTMLEAAICARVGPMAAVAGAIAEYVGSDLSAFSKNLIIENGGDIYLKTTRELNIAIFAGESPLSYKIALKIKPNDKPMGICTSSGTVGHSLSLGIADAVCVKAWTASIADAAATAIGNRVKNKSDIKKALEAGKNIKGVLGILIIVGNQFGVIGDMELT
ncbi:MAG: hypothetical protein A4E66_01611 [Syntrophus sp. PtaB.Bin001]|nr:MAG: hypothetical protein A4E66_01611 [Syntrophus sp. PtaB.Bin001]